MSVFGSAGGSGVRRRAGTVPSSSTTPMSAEVGGNAGFPYAGGHSNLSSLHINYLAVQGVSGPSTSPPTAPVSSVVGDAGESVGEEAGGPDYMVLG